LVSPEGIDLVQSSAKREDARLISSGANQLEAQGRELVSRIFTSWNQLDEWLRAVDGLRRAA
jgi:hypothetical protein